jgi:WD40 repeat protein
VSFSPDGDRLLVDGGNDIRLWDVTTPDAPKRLADLGTGSPTNDGYTTDVTTDDVSFLADGERALVVTGVTTAHVLDLDVEAKADQLCADVGDGITEEEWGAYLPEFPYTPPCGS